MIVDPFRAETFACRRGQGATLNGAPIRAGPEALEDAVVATGFAPNQARRPPEAVTGVAAPAPPP